MPKLTAWDRLQIVHEKGRPTVMDYIPQIFENYMEIHGDRQYGDDKAVFCALATLNSEPVTVIGQVKGRNLEENKVSNFAMMHPEGYRKALRAMKQAEKFGRPVICFIDTPGAFCGIQAEERGQGEAIARNLYEMSRLATPVISIILGEAGSGGALGLGVCDRLAMLENAQYSVISPRGFASILWKDASREKEAANVMKITAEDLVELGIAEDIIPEPQGGAQNNPAWTAARIREYLLAHLGELEAMPHEELLAKRYEKFRKIGVFEEGR